MVILDGAQIQTNLLLWKICHLELNYTEDICSNLTLDENNATMIEVQERANSFLMISEWLSAAPAFIWCLFSGKTFDSMQKLPLKKLKLQMNIYFTKPERIYNPITAMGFSAVFTFQLDNTKR